MKGILLAVAIGALVGVLGLVGIHEIQNYLDYQEALRLRDALISL